MSVKQNSIEVRLTEEDLTAILHWKDAHDAYCVKEPEYDTAAEKIQAALKRLEEKNA